MILRHRNQDGASTVLITISLLAASLSLSLVGAQDGDLNRATLRGLIGVEVGVDPLAPEIERAGLRTADIQTDTELKLRLAGIRVLTKDESRRLAASPFLIINIAAFKNATAPSYIYVIMVDLYQSARLTDPARQLEDSKTAHTGIYTLAQTWNARLRFGTAPEARFAEIVRQSVKEMVDQFVNAWLSANPNP